MPGRSLSFSAVTVLHAIADGSEYGFQIIDLTGLPSGTVYPALSRLERDGFLKSGWEDLAAAHAQKRPARRYYRITAHGRRELDASLERFRSLKPIKLGPSASHERSRG